MMASKSGKTLLLKTLIEKGADVNVQNEDGVTALMYAIEVGDEPIEMIDDKWPLDDCDYDLVKLDCVKALLEAGADSLVLDKMGENAFVKAAREDLFDVAYILLRLDFCSYNASIYKKFLRGCNAH